MELDQAATLARELMDRHGLDGWELRVCKMPKPEAGRAQRYAITLSRHVVATTSRAGVTDLILHEVAHALAGPEHGHREPWRAWCERIGADPEAWLPAYP